ncbi:acyl-CoA thioester hydrolase [Melghirimyces thermohalophilus]|uniref:Acyl-CoA thioester hydrolase n=1 Tax=Melghirimyces thermohalophilus TaxID=1236220 RepID=A0A1G6L7Z1_9BACL|nr:acyl-CoA thioester hydrolase [Melghirimyces thermohalophilus]
MAGHQFFRSIGLSPAKLEAEEKVILPMLDAGCTFEKPLYYDDIITIHTSVEEISRKTIRLKHEVFRGETRSGHGHEIRGWVRESEGRLSAVPIPDEVRTLLEQDSSSEPQAPNPWLST